MEFKEGVTYLSKWLTEQITNISQNIGIGQVSQRWAGLVVLLLAVTAGYVGIKIVQPVAKTLIIILSGLIILGLIFPW